MDLLVKDLIEYFESLGVEVNTNTKARGHLGFFSNNRIDISKKVKQERLIPTLLHEFSHFIHSKIEPDLQKTCGTLEKVFATDDIRQIKHELELVTNYVDETSLCHSLKEQKEEVKTKIKNLEKIIKQDYPHFLRSKKFKEFDKYIRHSKAKYLLKYDWVTVTTPFLRKKEVFRIENLEVDFPDMQKAFCAYIRLKAAQRKQLRISARINKLCKYYTKPTELFARFVEGIYSHDDKIQAIAPHSYARFFELLENGYYLELKNVFDLVQKEKLVANF